MADISDVLDGLVNLISAAIYPNGTDQESAAGIHAMVYPGWPLPFQLNADIAVGKAHVSVYPRSDERNTTRYPKQWQKQTAPNPSTITLTVNGSTVTVGGTVSVPQACMVILNGTAYSYQVLAADTLATIAAGLAALISGATTANAVITLPGVITLEARVIVAGTSIMEVRRQERSIQITIWAPTPTSRTNIAKIVDPALAIVERITLPDQTSARMIYKGSPMTDGLEKAKIYRRDLIYTVEYATTQIKTDYTIGQTIIETKLSVI